MKTRLSLALVLAALAALFLGADAPPVSVITFIGSNPTFTADGSLLTAPVQAMFQTTVVVDGTTYSKPESVSWDGNDAKHTVTINGKVLTYQEVTLAAAAIANIEKAGGTGSQKAATVAAAAATTP